MFRKFLLPALAIAMLSGCATDYTYRNGSGDYYYGRPQVEYRHIGGYGFGGYGYGSGSYGYGPYGYGGYGYDRPIYYYDRFGRLVLGYPYGYRSPYSGSYWRHRTRPHHGGDRDRDRDHDNDNDNDGNRSPPWRNIGGMPPAIEQRRMDAREDNRLRRQPAQLTPQQAPQVARPAIAPLMRERGDRSFPRTDTRPIGAERFRAKKAAPTLEH